MNILKTISVFSKIILLFTVIFSISSCSKNTVFNQYQNMVDNQWHKDSIINFTINSTDTISKNNIYVNLRNNKDYEFSNLF